MVECLTRDQGVVGSSLCVVSLIKPLYSLLSSGATPAMTEKMLNGT